MCVCVCVCVRVCDRRHPFSPLFGLLLLERVYSKCKSCYSYRSLFSLPLSVSFLPHRLYVTRSPFILHFSHLNRTPSSSRRYIPEVVAKARAQAKDSGRNLRIVVAGALVQAGTVSPAPTPSSVASTPPTPLAAPPVPMPSPASRMIPAHRDGVDVLAQALAENIHRTALKTAPDRGGILRVRVYPSH